jgi:hypothetical protein
MATTSRRITQEGEVMARTLQLTNPMMHGADVKEAQKLLDEHGFLAKKYVDGVFGIQTAHATENAKFHLGYPARDIKPQFGDLIRGILSGKIKPSKQMVRLANERKGTSFLKFEEMAQRHQIVQIAHWGVANTYSIHYEELRPIDGISHKYKLPLWTDCSGFATLCYKWAGAPDPNGRAFDGYGYTGTLLQHMKHIPHYMADIADLVVFGSFPGHHVVILTGLGGQCVSHGQEHDPSLTNVEAEAQYQPAGITYLTMRNWNLPLLLEQI